MMTWHKKNRLHFTAQRRWGFTLIEAITVLVIASIVMIATLKVYSNVRNSVETINRKMDENVLPTEIMQRIAEDLDRLAAPGFDTSLTLRNKNADGFNITQLIIENKFYGNGSSPETYERVIWQTAYDMVTNSLVLFRAHNGLRLEDGLTDRTISGEPREGIEKFVPLCSGITYFDIQVPNGDNFLTQWNKDQLPAAIAITISFAEPVENEFGEFVIPEDKFIYRTIAVDRTRKISFKFTEKEFDLNDLESNDPNDLGSYDAADENIEQDASSPDMGNDSTTDAPGDESKDKDR